MAPLREHFLEVLRFLALDRTDVLEAFALALSGFFGIEERRDRQVPKKPDLLELTLYLLPERSPSLIRYRLIGIPDLLPEHHDPSDVRS
jgi:hypothetical protein